MVQTPPPLIIQTTLEIDYFWTLGAKAVVANHLLLYRMFTEATQRKLKSFPQRYWVIAHHPGWSIALSTVRIPNGRVTSLPVFSTPLPLSKEIVIVLCYIWLFKVQELWQSWVKWAADLEYLSCQVRSSSVRAAISPLGNLSASLRKLVSILTMWCSFSKSLCLRFSISTWRCRLDESPHCSQAHPHSSSKTNKQLSGQVYGLSRK